MNSDQGKPEHCRKCRIKDCATKRQITYCFECSEYPCKQIKRLEKSYSTRYHTSLMENSQMIKEQGMACTKDRQVLSIDLPEQLAVLNQWVVERV